MALKAPGPAPPRSSFPEEPASPEEVPAYLQRLGKIETTLAARVDQAILDDDFAVLVKAVPLLDTVVTSIARNRPPPKPDPMTDPDNVSARDELRERLQSIAEELVKTPEARARVLATFGGT